MRRASLSWLYSRWSPMDSLLPGPSFATAFLDGSKRDGQSLSLCAVAALNNDWVEFDEQWRSLLMERGAIDTLHMKHLMPKLGNFRSPDPNEIRWTISGASDLLACYTHESRILVVTCTIDLQAFQKWSKRKKLYSPDFVCARAVVVPLLRWYSSLPLKIASQVDLNFDRNEPFRKHIERLKLNHPLRTGLLALSYLDRI